MFSIPLNSWQKKTNDKLYFDEFRLEAQAKVVHALKAGLSAFTISQKAENVLILKQAELPISSAEGYEITINPQNISIVAPSMIGLHFALATLKLQLATGGHYLAQGVICDVPKFASRGIMLDVSRGKMPTMEYIKNLISLMSDLKYNILQLYCEDKLALSKHPEIGKLTGAYTKEQIIELDEYCKERFIQLQPCIQTYSHMHGILRLPQYSHLAENNVLFSLAAGNEEVYSLLDDEFSETLPWFSCKTLNINMDEAYDIGSGYTKQAVETNGVGHTFLTHIKRVVEIARKHGAKTIVMWGDVVNKYPELLSDLPEDIIVSDWNYNPQTEYPSLDIFQKTGKPFWAAGGVNTWNSIFPRVYNTYTNLINYSKQAAECGACGFLVTDWGDYGHMQPLGLSLYGYMIGAQQAFYASEIEPKIIENNAFPLIFCNDKVKEAFKLLMKSNLAQDVQTGFKTMTIYYMFDDMLNGLGMKGNDKYPRVLPQACDVLYENGLKAKELLSNIDNKTHIFPDEHWARLFGDDFIEELALSAKMTYFTGKKGRLAYKIKATLKSENVCAKDILALINEIKALYAEFTTIRRDFEKVWLLRAYEAGMEGCLTVFDRAGVQMAETAKWLGVQLDLLANGKPVDKELTTYSIADNYYVLWTSDFKNMWDRAYPWQ